MPRPVVAIEVKDVKKRFYIPHNNHDSLKTAITQAFKPKARGGDEFYALNGISFNVEQGDFFGVLGRNGSGKSTLLKIISDIYRPTSGTVKHRGKLVSFIELGVGFKKELTGRENVFLNGALLGFSKKEVEAIYDEIVEFAELERFMDQKLKNYSSGMKVRLAFSVAIRAKADILILDEVLAVGDAAFKKKCNDYFASLKDNKKTVILVTHGMGAVRKYCNKAVVIENGKIIFNGSGDGAADEYARLFTDTKNSQQAQSGNQKSNQLSIESVDVKLKDEEMEINVGILGGKNVVNDVKLNLRILDNNKPVASLDSVNAAGGRLLSFKPYQKSKVVFKFPNVFADKTYTVNASISSGAGPHVLYDVRKQAASFTTSNSGRNSPVLLPAEFKIDK